MCRTTEIADRLRKLFNPRRLKIITSLTPLILVGLSIVVTVVYMSASTHQQDQPGTTTDSALTYTTDRISTPHLGE